MKDSLLFAGIFIAWIVLNRWVLPHFGVQTCMSGACTQAPRDQTSRDEGVVENKRAAANELVRSNDAESPTVNKSPHSKAHPLGE